MGPVVVYTVLAMLGAVIVLVVTAAMTDRSRGVGQFLADLRAGLRRDEGQRQGLLAGARQEMADVAEVETGSVDELFTVGEPQESAYVRADDITKGLGKATTKAVRTVAQVTRR